MSDGAPNPNRSRPRRRPPTRPAEQAVHGLTPTAILGAAVRRQRRQLGLRQTMLADLAGVGAAFLYDLEKGKPTLRIDKVLAVLGALGLGLTVGPSSVLVHSEVGEPTDHTEDPT